MNTHILESIWMLIIHQRMWSRTTVKSSMGFLKRVLEAWPLTCIKHRQKSKLKMSCDWDWSCLMLSLEDLKALIWNQIKFFLSFHLVCFYYHLKNLETLFYWNRLSHHSEKQETRFSFFFLLPPESHRHFFLLPSHHPLVRLWQSEKRTPNQGVIGTACWEIGGSSTCFQSFFVPASRDREYF